ncbi:MAG: zinc ABC transporter substrate-binding protein [Rhizobiaceae bacterium]
MARHMIRTALAAFLATTPAIAASPDVVVSIKPLHSLVARIMDGVGTPALIVDGAASPHDFALKPSQAAMLERADIVLRIGHGLETFLDKPLESLATGAIKVDLAETAGLVLLPPREGGAFEAHVHDDEGHGTEAGHDDAHAGEDELDSHIWLDPRNAGIMAGEIARLLAAADPENATRYAGNAATLQSELTALEAEVAIRLAQSRGRPFIVFHDAYHYFENRFGLTAAGSITINPEIAPGAARLSELVAKVKQTGARCVFSEPQFDPKLVAVIAGDSGVRTGVLDPLGARVEPGPALYGTVIRSLAEAMAMCLAP